MSGRPSFDKVPLLPMNPAYWVYGSDAKKCLDIKTCERRHISRVVDGGQQFAKELK